LHRIGELLRGYAQLTRRRLEPLNGVVSCLRAKLLDCLFNPLLGNVECLGEAAGKVAHVHASDGGPADAMTMRSLPATGIPRNRRRRR
jgi:hypothetical protein